MKKWGYKKTIDNDFFIEIYSSINNKRIYDNIVKENTEFWVVHNMEIHKISINFGQPEVIILSKNGIKETSEIFFLDTYEDDLLSNLKTTEKKISNSGLRIPFIQQAFNNLLDFSNIIDYNNVIDLLQEYNISDLKSFGDILKTNEIFRNLIIDLVIPEIKKKFVSFIPKLETPKQEQIQKTETKSTFVNNILSNNIKITITTSTPESCLETFYFGKNFEITIFIVSEKNINNGNEIIICSDNPSNTMKIFPHEKYSKITIIPIPFR